LVLNNLAAQESTAACLVSRCKPRLNGERCAEGGLLKRFSNRAGVKPVILKIQLFEL
jgi:hypothetical protein